MTRSHETRPRAQRAGWRGGLLAALLLALLGTAAAQPGTVLRLAIPADPLMNPILGTDAAAVPINRFFFNALTRPDPETFEPRPDLATSWEVSEDGLRWTFELVDNATWHDGEPFTAEDVKFTYDTILDPNNNSPRRSAIAVIESVEVVDDYTVRFHLSSPLGSFPTIASYNVGIVPRHVLEGQNIAEATEFNTRHPISTGPYEIASVTPGSQYEFVANPDYFKGAPPIERVIFKVLPDVNTQVAQLLSGELDYAVVQPTNLPALQRSNRVKIQSVPYLGFEHISFNYEHPLFSDPRVRLAMIYGLDREAIIQSVMGGEAVIGVGPIPPVFPWAFDDELEPVPYDPDRARELLAEAGWTPGPDGVLQKDGERFAFEIGVDQGNPTRERTTLIAQQAYQALGMDVGVRVDEWPVYVQKLLGGEWVAHAGFWVLPPDPDLTNYYAPGQAFNTVHYDNPRVTELLEAGRATSDQAERAEIYKELQQVMYEDPPGVVLFYPQDIQAMNARLTTTPLPFREALQWVEQWRYEGQ
jgi:peptide/nickel transport system substrate-binding protein